MTTPTAETLSEERLREIETEFKRQQEALATANLNDGPGSVSSLYTSLAVADVLGLVALARSALSRSGEAVGRPYVVLDEEGTTLVPDDQAAAIKAAFEAVKPLAPFGKPLRRALKFFLASPAPATSPDLMERARELYEALFRVGKHRLGRVPGDPEALILQALAAAEQRGAEREREACAVIAERDTDWTRFGKTNVQPWESGPDDTRDYRLGIVAGRSIAAAIRNRKD